VNKLAKSAVCAAIFSSATATYSYQLPVHFFIEGGGYGSHQGKAQNVAITGLIGDHFSVTDQNDTNTIFGVGVLVDGWKRDRYGIDYGINVFYLAKTRVTGTITQEFLFTNLAYQYYVSHLPVYAFAKGYVNTNYNNLAVTVDAGIGPNFMYTTQYADSPLNANTLPDNAYVGNVTTTVFSAMAGIGLKLNVMGQVPVELGYRYFFLGEGQLKPRTTQILNNLKTGNASAQALVLTVSI